MQVVHVDMDTLHEALPLPVWPVVLVAEVTLSLAKYRDPKITDEYGVLSGAGCVTKTSAEIRANLLPSLAINGECAAALGSEGWNRI